MRRASLARPAHPSGERLWCVRPSAGYAEYDPPAGHWRVPEMLLVSMGLFPDDRMLRRSLVASGTAGYLDDRLAAFFFVASKSRSDAADVEVVRLADLLAKLVQVLNDRVTAFHGALPDGNSSGVQNNRRTQVRRAADCLNGTTHRRVCEVPAGPCQ